MTERITVTINNTTTTHRVGRTDGDGKELTDNQMLDVAINRAVRQHWGRNAYWVRNHGSVGAISGEGNIMRDCDPSHRSNVIMPNACPDARFS